MGMQERLDGVVERQAKQLAVLGIAMLVIAAFCIALGAWGVEQDGDKANTRLIAYGFIIGGAGVAPLWRARRVRRELRAKAAVATRP